MVQGKLDTYMQKNETGPLSNTTQKINSKWIKDLKTLNCKTPRRKHWEKATWHQSQQVFLDMTPKAQATKTKINKWDYNKLKSVCIAKETIDKIKR